MPVEERHRKLREYREKQYASLQDAAYLRRGWDPKTSVITKDKATAIFPGWVLKEVQPYISKYW
ncbi:MAG: hypothetical protein ACXACI_13210 [Candidatus Hodarchaeales archaeon]